MLRKKIALLSVFFLTIMAGVVFSGRIYAQDSSQPTSYPSSAATGVSSVSTTSFTGKLIKVDNNTYTLQSDSATKQFNIADGSKVSVTRNGSAAQLSDVQINDQLTIQYDQNNNVIKIDSSSVDYVKIALIVLVILIVLGLLAAMLLGNRNKSHIKTEIKQL